MRVNQRPPTLTARQHAHLALIRARVALTGIQRECGRLRTWFSILTAKQWHTAGVLAILLCLKRAEGRGEGGNLRRNPMKELLEFYQGNDYVVVPDALFPDEVHTINEIIDRDLVENPAMWFEREDGH